MMESTRLLRELVAIPSINPMGRPASGPEFFEHRVTDYLERFFREMGVPYERQTVAPLRDNIVASFPGPLHEPGAAGRPTLLFEAHQDTVPAEHMTIEPYAAKIENGKLYGRGACDIKGGLAAMLSAFARVVQDHPRGTARVIMACVVDEEFTFQGITELVRRGVRADMAVVAEPTQLAIVNAHKGVVRWHMHTQGRSCHSSSPDQGINAIYRMGRLLMGIEEYAARLKESGSDAALGPPTMSVGRIDGGVSVNVVPERCSIEVDRRLIPGEEGAKAQSDLVAFLRSRPGMPPFECEQAWMSKPPLSPKNSEGLVRRLGAAIDAVQGEHRVMGVPYGTDAPPLAEADIPTVVFGPGDIAQAHTCDEWVSVDEVGRAAEILYQFAIEKGDG